MLVVVRAGVRELRAAIAVSAIAGMAVVLASCSSVGSSAQRGRASRDRAPAAVTYDEGAARLAVAGRHAALSVSELRRGAWRTTLDADARADRDGATTWFRRGAGVLEWWSARALGLEHGAVLEARPEGTGPLEVRVHVEGELRPTLVSEDEVALVAPDGVRAATYAQLVVDDASGRRVPGRMHVAGGDIVLAIDDAGARYPLVVDPLLVTYDGALTTRAVPSSPGAQNHFGSALAVTPDGTRLVVVSPRYTSSSFVYASGDVYVRSGSTWTPDGAIDTGRRLTDGYSGVSVAISPDGSNVLLGTYDAGTNSQLASFVPGSPYWAREDDPFIPGTTPRKGFALAMTATRVVATDPVATTGRGATGTAWTLVRGIVNGRPAWTQETQLDPGDAEAGDELGASAALSGDGLRVVVGAAGDDTTIATDSGSVRSFVRAGTTWSFERALVPADARSGDRFGAALAMSGDGTRVLVGAPGDDTAAGPDAGTARVFVRSGAMWSEEAVLVPADAGAYARFGNAVALSSDASRAFVAAAWETHAGVFHSGAVHVFVRSGSSWAEEAVLAAPDALTNDQLGVSLAVPADGSRVVVGAPLDDDAGLRDVGTVRTFSLSRAPTGAACGVNATCGTGFCVDGVCCSTACNGGRLDDCQACSAALTGGVDGACAVLASAVAPTVACRPAAGSCDVAEVCAPGLVACPADVRQPGGFECRASTGICDLAEVCTGTSAACPSDAFEDPSTVCRAATAPCDGAERCTGTGASCPPDVVATSGTVCRPSSGPCDGAEVCDGASTACPADVLQPLGHVCRAPAGTCDVEERCSGASALCPVDVVLPSGRVCLAADPTNVCDVDDVCDGASPACAPAYAPSTVECAPAGGDLCDAPDHCAGASARCVAEFVTGVECRPSSGGCDVAELCDGRGASCPSDGVEPAGLSCRASTDPSCDPEEVCDGASSACPADENRCAGHDGGPPVDAGRDAATAGDASAPLDGSAGLLDAAGSAPQPAGCACRSARATRTSPALLSALVTLALLRCARRRVRGARS